MPPIENVSPTPAAPPTVDTSDVEDYGQRIHMVQEAANAEAKASRSAEDQDDGPAPPSDSDNSDEDEAPVKAKAKEKEEPAAKTSSPEDSARKASLANAARLERESVKRSTELAAKASELKAQESKFAEREKVLSDFEKAFNDPDALLSLLAEKVTPEKMSRFFIEQGQPDKVAERRAKAAQEPVNSELAKLHEKIAALQAETDSHRKQAARASSEKDFSARVQEMKTDVPHAARLLSKRPEAFFTMADSSAAQLITAAEAEGRPAPQWDDVILDINKQLLEFTRDLQDEVSATSSTPEKSTKSAAAKAPTVSNRAASERSAILNEEETWENLPYDERVKRAEKRARQTG